MTLIRKKSDGFPVLGSMLTDLFDSDRFFQNDFFNKDFMPAVNVKETKNGYKVHLAVPGFEKEDFKISVENGMLSISSEKEDEKDEENETFTRREFNYSSFRRSFSLPENADAKSIDANYKNGVLKINIGKKEEAKDAAIKEIPVG